jgi:hypothetical protein
MPDLIARNARAFHRDPASDLIEMTFAQKLSRYAGEFVRHPQNDMFPR